MIVLGLDDEAAQELVNAWNTWETRPGGVETQRRFAAAVEEVSAELGISTSATIERLMVERRAGYGPESSLRRVMGDPRSIEEVHG